mmetsp:Transcript_87082/g.159506  ORF Transcript_87082/g.159506 Transcript_87082/m.159506 type:complete len:152 (+) Transcript_87082:1-456(+)
MGRPPPLVRPDTVVRPPVRPAMVARPPPPWTPQKAQPSEEAQSAEYCKQEIYRLYQKFNPEQLAKWEVLCQKYEGNEFGWLEAMQEKYLQPPDGSAWGDPAQDAEAPRRSKVKLPTPPPSSRNRQQQRSSQGVNPPPPPSSTKWKRPWMQH